MRMRLTVAMLATASGIGHIGAMWFRDLDGSAVNGALFGALYLVIGIGLFGQSRLSLFLAIVAPSCGTILVWRFLPPEAIYPIQIFSIGIDMIVIILSSVVLWNVRNNPSV